MEENLYPQQSEFATEVNRINLEKFANAMHQLKSNIATLLVGQQEVLDQCICCIFTGGHALIEGMPGVAKTLTAKLLAKSLNLSFNRIQFTPDLMPADVTGTNVFNLKSQEFEFRKGPIFSNIVLIDEINRSPAKTQAALFEVMEEGMVSSDSVGYAVPQPFLILATQNPVEQEGTYKLPEAQQDRFMMKILMGYPNLTEELKILERFNTVNSHNAVSELKPVLSAQEIAEIKLELNKVFVKPEIMHYIAGVMQATRTHKDLFLGASPRASLAVLRASKVIAAINNRDFVTPDDVRYVTFPILNHRLVLTPESEMDGITMDKVVTEILKSVEIPR